MSSETSVNPTLPYAYRLIIPGETQLMYDLINVDFPGITVSKTTQYHQDSIVNIPNDVYEIDDISFTILLSDKWLGYKRLVEWQKSSKLHRPNFKKNLTLLVFDGDFSVVSADISLVGAWPTRIGNVSFDYQSPDAIVMQLPVTLSLDGDFIIN